MRDSKVNILGYEYGSYVRMDAADLKSIGCDHIIGLSEGVHESWLTTQSNRESDKDTLDVRFVYCPQCGKRIS